MRRVHEALQEAKDIIVEVLGNDYTPASCPAPDGLCGDRYCQSIGCIADKVARINDAIAETSKP